MKQSEIDKYNQSQDIWFSGAHITGPNGNACYYICQYFNKLHFVEKEDQIDGKEFTTWCRFKDQFEDGSNCNLNCSEFGKCDTCGGFSAIRCSDCDIIRYE